MYKIVKLTAKESCVIRSGSSPEIQVVEDVTIPYLGYGDFSLRLSLAKQGVVVSPTKFHSGWRGKPTIVVSNFGANDVDIRKGDEIGEVWIFWEDV